MKSVPRTGPATSVIAQGYEFDFFFSKLGIGPAMAFHASLVLRNSGLIKSLFRLDMILASKLALNVKHLLCLFLFLLLTSPVLLLPQSGAADAEIKIPSVENTELKGSPFKA